MAARAGELETRGEFVLVIGPPSGEDAVMSETDLDEMLREAWSRGSVKDAVAQAVEVSGRSRREVYARALALSKAQDEG